MISHLGVSGSFSEIKAKQVGEPESSMLQVWNVVFLICKEFSMYVYPLEQNIPSCISKSQDTYYAQIKHLKT